ncbi:hypothetical protein SJAG_00917 [Schizosaccharomyces japonicus yFS275]|uniref:Uncharacterized protein n=1 Tax=Schizosaccharomyces japonicus (strain yFS275 / FY16936) TaxID=402676 RepID=B6JWZ2_SCHJY|nr:hypothetical protein SJAG_00917 [Schizosaccharomyces japonicus yFS275]EEB05893.2 hypothetical protein SJAG_00917 [Schizosaccharomyces japonicus yFS275]
MSDTSVFSYDPSVENDEELTDVVLDTVTMPAVAPQEKSVDNCATLADSGCSEPETNTGETNEKGSEDTTGSISKAFKNNFVVKQIGSLGKILGDLKSKMAGKKKDNDKNNIEAVALAIAVDDNEEEGFVPRVATIGHGSSEGSVITDVNDTSEWDPIFVETVRRYLMEGSGSGLVVQHEKRLPDGPRTLEFEQMYEEINQDSTAFPKTGVSRPSSDPQSPQSPQVTADAEHSDIAKRPISLGDCAQVNNAKRRRQSLLTQSKLVPIAEEEEDPSKLVNTSPAQLPMSEEVPDYGLGNEAMRKRVLDDYEKLSSKNIIVVGHKLSPNVLFAFDEEDIVPIENYTCDSHERSLLTNTFYPSHWQFRKLQASRFLHFENSHFDDRKLMEIPFIIVDNATEEAENNPASEEQHPPTQSTEEAIDDSHMAEEQSIREMAYFETKFISLIYPSIAQRDSYRINVSVAQLRERDFSQQVEDPTGYAEALKNDPCKLLVELDNFELLSQNQKTLVWRELAELSASQEINPSLCSWRKLVAQSRIGHPKLHVAPIQSFKCVKGFPEVVCVENSVSKAFFLIDKDKTTFDPRTSYLLSCAPTRAAQYWLLLMHHLEFIGRSFPHLVFADKEYSTLEYARSNYQFTEPEGKSSAQNVDNEETLQQV